MPPEKRKARSCGSPMTIRAPSRERMMSSIPWRSSVPGAIRSIAARSFGSRRGSSSEGVRVKPSGTVPRSSRLAVFSSDRIEPRANRLPERLHLLHAQFATSGRARRRDDLREPELRALLEAPLALRGGSEATGEADLAEGGDALPHRRAARGRGDRKRDSQVRSRLVDPHAPRHVHEYVGRAERDPRVAREPGDDPRPPL